MRVLFVYPNITGHESIQYGLMSLSACLKQDGHETGLIDFTFGEKPSYLLKQAVIFEPDLICFTGTSGMFRPAIEFAASLKERISKPIIFGGPHATVVPETVLKEEQIDMVCISEGEEALKELIEKMAAQEDYFHIKNIWVKDDGKIYRNPVRPLLADLDCLPFPDFELFDMEKYLEARRGTVDLFSGRGCPFKCSYCINHKLQEIQGQQGKRYVRKHSVNYIIKLIKSLIKKYSIESIDFEDDIFLIYKDWILEFCHEFKYNFPQLRFSCSCRVESADYNIFLSLKEAGCAGIAMGIEAGDEYIRRKILRRNMSDEQIIRAFAAVKKAGLKTASFNILGSPFETIEQMKKTIDINRIIQPDHIGVSICCPYPGTRLYDLAVEAGLIDPDFDVPSQHRSKVVLRTDSKTRRRIKKLKKIFRYEVYKKNNRKKALIFLVFDMFYDYFILIRSRVPMTIKKLLFLVYYKVDSYYNSENKEKQP